MTYISPFQIQNCHLNQIHQAVPSSESSPALYFKAAAPPFQNLKKKKSLNITPLSKLYTKALSEAVV